MALQPRSGLRAVLQVGPAVVYTVCIFVGGSVPMPEGPPGGLGDKVLHGFAFGLFVPVLFVAIRYLNASSLPATLGRSVALSSALGMLLEIWQVFCPTRTFELLDWVADTAGALAAGAVLLPFLLLWTRLASGTRVRLGLGQAPPGV